MDRLQKSHCEDLLRLIPKYDLLPLAESITNLDLPSAENAVTYILNYIKAPRELLERQHMKKDYLREYLLIKKKAVPKDAKKHELIETILNMWKLDINPVFNKGICSPLPKAAMKQKIDINEPQSRRGLEIDEHIKTNCEELLRLIPHHELIQMAGSITQLEIPSTKDALMYILRQFKTPRELLESYPMTKDYLKGYILYKGKAVPKDAKKIELIEIILKLWMPFKNSDNDPSPFKRFGWSALSTTGSNTNVSKRKDVSPSLSNAPKKQKMQAKELNEDQKALCKELLKIMPKIDLFSLAECSSLVKCTSTKEAINTILMSVKTPEELLKKNAMKKTFLTLYLIQNKKQYPSNAKKDELIDIILRLWDPKLRKPADKARGSTSEDQKQKDSGWCSII